MRQRGSSTVLHVLLAVTLITLSVGHSLCAEYAARIDELYASQAPSAVFVSELAKLVFAVPSLAVALRQKAPVSGQLFRIVLKMSVPAFLYTVVNIMSYYVIRDVGSTRYQLFSNVKVVITAVTFRAFLGVRLKLVQWFCVLLLVLGLCIGTIQSEETNADAKALLLRGVVGIFVVSLCSSLAGVYFELCIKQAEVQPLLQNFILYCWTCFMSFTHSSLFGSSLLVAALRGQFSAAMWLSILTSSLYGQSVALTLYYCDNMLKVFATSLAVFVSGVLESVCFASQPHSGTYYGGAVTILATLVYYCDHNLLLEYDDTLIRRFLK